MTALQKLTSLAWTAKRARHPGIPEHAMVKPSYNDTTANGLTRAILVWCELKGHYSVRVTTTGRQIKGASVVDVIGRTRVMPGKWIPGTTRPGTADIHAVIGGKHCSIEVKVGRDRMSEAQERTKQDVEAAGGLFFVAKDFESFYNWYQSIIGQ